jgi:hypothetical protein
MKSKSITKAFLILAAISNFLTACKNSNRPDNNWTEEDKSRATATVKFVLDANPTFREKKDEILDNTIEECIIKYPNVEDFRRDSNYVQAAFSAALMKSLPKQ